MFQTNFKNYTQNSLDRSKNSFLTNVKRAVFFGSEEDGVIGPWQSTVFGYYDQKGNIVDMGDTVMYKNDTFGLKTMDKAGRLNLITPRNITHTDWILNKEVIAKYIIPLLD